MKHFIYKYIALVMLLVAFSVNGRAQSHIGDVSVDVGSTATVVLPSTYASVYNNPGTQVMSWSWSSSNTRIFSVTSSSRDNAIIKGVNAGNARLIYKSGFYINGYYRTYNFYFDVTVSDIVEERGLELETYAIVLTVDESVTFTATQSGVAGDVYCQSDDNTIATASAGTRDGWKTPITVTGISPGETTIYVKTLAGLSRACQVTVNAKPVAATEISLPETQELNEGEQLQLLATVTPVNSTSKLTWESDNLGVATVSPDGLVTALSTGTANITVTTDNNLRATCCITVLPGPATAYAVFYDGVLTFYFDKLRASRNGTAYSLNTWGNSPRWWEHRLEIKKVVFDPSFADARPTTAYQWFGLCGDDEISPLATIEGWEYFNTSELTDVTDLFRNCRSLTSLDLSNFDTSHVTNMYGMFRGCSNLVNINLSNFNTENVRTMDKMFSGCSSLANLDLGNFETSHVSGMKAMFSGCSSLANLDLGSFDTKNVLDMACMFSGCSSLTNLDLGSFNTRNIIYMGEMFAGCSSLASIDLGGFNTINVITMNAMFSGCSSLDVLDLSSFDTRNVAVSFYMFYGCDKLTTIYCGDKWNLHVALRNGIGMFGNCNNLVGGSGTVYEPYHDDVSYAHADGGSENPGYMTWKMNGTGDMASMAYAIINNNSVVLTFYFDNKVNERDGIAYYLEEDFIGLPAEFWTDDIMVSFVDETTGATADMRMAGVYCIATTVDFDPSFASCHLASTSGLFQGMIFLNNINHMEYLNTSEVTDMAGMFQNCQSLESIDLSLFDTSKVTNMSNMFSGCRAITMLDLSSFNTSKVEDMSGMFSNCKNLTTIYVGEKWNMENVRNSEGMFQGCDNLVGGQGTNVDPDQTDDSYAHVDGGVGNPGYLTLKNEGNPDGVETVRCDGRGMQDGACYTLDGRRVKDTSRPNVYIVNGRKVLVK